MKLLNRYTVAAFIAGAGLMAGLLAPWPQREWAPCITAA